MSNYIHISEYIFRFRFSEYFFELDFLEQLYEIVFQIFGFPNSLFNNMFFDLFFTRISFP